MNRDFDDTVDIPTVPERYTDTDTQTIQALARFSATDLEREINRRRDIQAEEKQAEALLRLRKKVQAIKYLRSLGYTVTKPELQ